MRNLASILGASALLASTAVWATDYPTQPVTLVIPFSPGGLTDTSGRLIGERLSEELGQPVVIENRAGAGTTVASNWVAQQEPDGYTIYAASVSMALNHLIQDEVNYTLDDFTYISGWIDSPFILHVHPSLEVSDMDELLAKIRENPDTYAIGTSGVGAVNHLASEFWVDVGDLDLAIVHYQGGAPARQDLLAGNIEMMFAATLEALPILEAGNTVGIAVTTRDRLDVLPDLPTVEEAMGLDFFEAVFWQTLVTPAGTPDDVVERLRSAMEVVGQDEELRAALAEQGVLLNVTDHEAVMERLATAEDVFGPLLERAARSD